MPVPHRGSAFVKIFTELAPARRTNQGLNGVALTLLLFARMVDRRRGRDSFEESLERSLDKGVSLPAPDRLVAMTTRDGEARLGIVVRKTQPLFERTIDPLPTARGAIGT